MIESMPPSSRLFQHVRPQAWPIAGLSLMTALGAGAVALQPWPLKLLVDNVLGGAPLPAWLLAPGDLLGLDPALSGLAVAVAAILFLFGLGAICEAATALGWTYVGRRMTYDLGADLFDLYQRRSLAFHARMEVGEKLARVADDSWIAYRTFDQLVFKPLQALLILGFMLTLMLGLDAQLALIVACISPLMVLASAVSGKQIQLTAEATRSLDGRIRAHVQQSLAGIGVIQAFGHEEMAERKLRDFADQAVGAQQRTALLKGVSGLTSGLVGAVGTGLVLWLCAHRVLTGSLSIGALLVFVAYLRASQSQVALLARVYPTAKTLSAIRRRVGEGLTTPSEIVVPSNAPDLPAVAGRVELRDVRFGYDPAIPILNGVSLVARPGETVALVGATGAGKSTLVSLLPRFFDPTSGQVLIDGQDIKGVTLASLRRQVAIVLQEPFLFPVTISDNIAFGRPGATRAAIEQAARAANAHDFIARLPDGYDTPVGERGATLSGGERQRLSIARAILKDAPILILDEPTSALDAATETEIMAGLKALMTGRTTFVIAHRLSTVREADQIIVLAAGKVFESGTHEALLAKAGLYANFSALQMGDLAGTAK